MRQTGRLHRCRRALPLIAVLWTGSGCVERYLEIATNPAGARLVVNGTPVDAPSPATVPFTTYGTFRIDAWLPEQPAVTQFVEVDTPWWQWFPLDLVTELLQPFTLVDRHRVTLDLAGAAAERPDRAQLLESADALRKASQ